jgi:hypothetical protein
MKKVLLIGKPPSIAAPESQWQCYSQMAIPESELWLQAVQMICIAVLGISAVVCQWSLDKTDDSSLEPPSLE